MGIQWVSKVVKVTELKPYERNPRRISQDAFAKLKESIQQDGYHKRIIANADLTVIGGHQRLKALKELGIKDIEVLTPAEQISHENFRRILVRDNLPFGEFDFDVLSSDFEADELVEWGMPEEWMPKQDGVQNITEGDEDEAPEPPVIPQTVRGDIYEIGSHRLMCGDSTLIDDVDKLMDGAKADMVFTDPPYGVEYQSNRRVKSDKFAVLKNDDVQLDIVPIIESCSSGWVFIWTTWKVLDKWLSKTAGMGFPTNMVIWHKGGGGIGDLKKTFSTDYELALVFNRGAELIGKRIGSVWVIGKDGASTYQHPTQKPVALAVEALDKTTSTSAKVLDLFGGSGSTMVAAHKLGRTGYLMELDEKCCDVIVSRMHKLFPDLPITRNGTPFSVKVAEKNG